MKRDLRCEGKAAFKLPSGLRQVSFPRVGDFLTQRRKGKYNELGILAQMVFSGGPSRVQGACSPSERFPGLWRVFYGVGSPRLTIEAAYYLPEAHNVLHQVTALQQAPKLYLDKE